LIVSPHAAAVVNDDDDNDDRRRGRGEGWHAPPQLQTVPSRWMPLVHIANVANSGRRRRHEGIRSVVIRAVEEEEVRTVVFDCQVMIQPGVDDRGKR
jgi:hypothetical protein